MRPAVAVREHLARLENAFIALAMLAHIPPLAPCHVCMPRRRLQRVGVVEHARASRANQDHLPMRAAQVLVALGFGHACIHPLIALEELMP